MVQRYFVYITTNSSKHVLYTGMTNDLEKRLTEHYLNRGQKKTVAGRYYAYHLIYFETYESPIAAIEREKELTGWNKQKKESLINKANPNWTFYNDRFMEWPPKIILS